MLENPDEPVSLQKLYELTKENNEILRSLRTQQRWATAFRTLYWIAILASLGGAYYYVKPLISAFQDSGVKMGDALQLLTSLRNSLPEAQLIEGIFNSFKSGASATQ